MQHVLRKHIIFPKQLVIATDGTILHSETHIWEKINSCTGSMRMYKWVTCTTIALKIPRKKCQNKTDIQKYAGK